MFWNYFSVGLDAKAAWGFHSLREARPGCTNSRPANQFWYSFFSCTSGWFCCAQPLNIKVRRGGRGAPPFLPAGPRNARAHLPTPATRAPVAFES